MELNSGNLGSQCEAVIVVLQGLMSSEGGTSAGGVTGGVTDSELAKICHQSHMSVTGCNTIANDGTFRLIGLQGHACPCMMPCRSTVEAQSVLSGLTKGLAMFRSFRILIRVKLQGVTSHNTHVTLLINLS